MWETKLAMGAKLLVLLFTVWQGMHLILESMYGGASMWERALGIIVVLAALWLLFQRDVFLPFLGETVFPAAAIAGTVVPEGSDAETVVHVDAPNGSRVVYWAAASRKAESGGKGEVLSPDPWKAYADYTNAGVAIVMDGIARLRLRCPGRYKVAGGMKKLPRHVHYRVCCTRASMLGPVITAKVECG